MGFRFVAQTKRDHYADVAYTTHTLKHRKSAVSATYLILGSEQFESSRPPQKRLELEGHIIAKWRRVPRLREP